MYLSTVAILLAASGVKATAIVAQRASSNLVGRDIVQGWSLQSPASVSGLTKCGGTSYCPSSLTCNDAANDEVAACCTSSSDCRGDVEGSPKCADSSWDLYSGYMGNGFCCEGGMVGAYDTSDSVAGTCVASGDIGSLQTAVLTSTGSGAAATTSASAASSTSSASSASVTSSASVKSSSVSSTSKSESTDSSSSSSSKASAPTNTPSTSTISSGAPSTGSSTSSSATTSATGSSGAEKVGMGFGLMGAAFLAVAAL